uniref:Uncharacterized protein n=1 Tax=Anguilla anguilla TaxID=7936 RepID=A0A0E9X3N7_ANGAN
MSTMTALRMTAMPKARVSNKETRNANTFRLRSQPKKAAHYLFFEPFIKPGQDGSASHA